MSNTGTMTILTAICMVLLFSTAAVSGETCSGCNDGCADCCEFWAEDGLSNFIELGVTTTEVTDNEDSFNQYGEYPEDWYTSGRYNSSEMRLLRQRFEARWQDVTEDNGRAWGRLTMWPFTLQGNSALISGRAWDAFGPDPALIDTEVAMDEYNLRFHHRDFTNLALNYRVFEINRNEATDLSDLKVERIRTTWNLDIIGIDTMAQVQQTGTRIETTIPGASGDIDRTRIKIDANLSDELRAYGRMNYAQYEYDSMPDPEFAGSDYTVGMKYTPNDDWSVNAEVRTKENPDDNIVSSHIEDFSEYGLALNWYPGCGNSYEAGYKLRKLDYAKLDMQDPLVFTRLRGSSVLTPADVAPVVTVLSPEFDVFWFNMRQNINDRLLFRTRVDFQSGSVPGTELGKIGSPSLFFDKQLSRSHGFSYTVDACNQLELNIRAQESVNSPRDSSSEMAYAEGVWIHRIDSCSQFSLALRDTASDITIPGVDLDAYTTDDTTYMATYGQQLEDHDYTINFALSDGSGAEEYTQTSAGAGVTFKRMGPLGLRFDWYRREYVNFPAFDSDAVSVALDYRIKF